MAINECVGADTEVGVISPSPSSSVTSHESGLSSNNDQGGSSHAARSDGGESFKRDMRELHELLSKLNPMAEEFVPPSLTKQGDGNGGLNGGFLTSSGFFFHNNGFAGAANGSVNENGGFRRKKSFGQGKRRMNARTSMAQREDVIRRTVYVSDLDQQVTEEQLAGLFVSCGQVVDCRICGDPNSVLRFAFIEFTDEEGAMTALNLSGTML